MKTKEIKQAILLAKSFIHRAEALLSDPALITVYNTVRVSKKSGALRRSSMEITRQLAKMRKP